MFETEGDYFAFERTLAETQQRISMRILAWCLMPNHWHLLLWPERDGELSDFMRILTLTHTQRWHAYRDTVGHGHLYQGRFKSFVVSDDAYFLAAARYVEANALRAGLVRRAEDWRWGSLWRATRGESAHSPRTSPWPVAKPSEWLSYVNDSALKVELDSLRKSSGRGVPFGPPDWTSEVAVRLGLQSTLRPRGRPSSKKSPDPVSQRKGS
jgi:putative transposase